MAATRVFCRSVLLLSDAAWDRGFPVAPPLPGPVFIAGSPVFWMPHSFSLQQSSAGGGPALSARVFHMFGCSLDGSCQEPNGGLSVAVLRNGFLIAAQSLSPQPEGSFSCSLLRFIPCLPPFPQNFLRAGSWAILFVPAPLSRSLSEFP